MKELKIKIHGVAPLLQHQFHGTINETSKRKSGVSNLTAEEEAEKAAYKNKNGYYEPSRHIEGCLIKAAANFRIPGRGRKTYKDLMKSAIIVDPEEIPLTPQEYEIFSAPVVISRSRIMRSRPKFNDWELEFKININDDQVKPELVKDILEHGGRNVGLGDWRPKYGRFEVTKFEVEENGN